jgi:hypothetical protein
VNNTPSDAKNWVDNRAPKGTADPGELPIAAKPASSKLMSVVPWACPATVRAVTAKIALIKWFIG